jgi:16S rRNA (cytosine967-C5)-methyltransferase
MRHNEQGVRKRHLTDPREIALHVLWHGLPRTAPPCDQILHDYLEASELRPPDARLATELTYGVLRHLRYLDHVLSSLLHEPIRRLPDAIRHILRIATYQVLFLTRVPAYAIVDEAVGLAKRYGRPVHAKLVNAVLRSLTRTQTPLPLPHKKKNVMHYLSIKYSHPLWMVRLFIEWYGSKGAEALLKFNNQAAPLDLRVNALRASPDELIDRIREKAGKAKITRGIFGAETVRIEAPSTKTWQTVASLTREGLAYVQDEASQLIAHYANPRPGERLVDFCAPPGGKATHLAQLQNDTGDILACAQNKDHLKSISKNCSLLGIQSVKPCLLSRELLEECIRHPADRVLVDAPCTGLGTIRRHPDIKWKKRPADIVRLAQLQLDILATACRLVRPHGLLIYSTCTMAPTENEFVVQQFLTTHPGFSVDTSTAEIPDALKTLLGPDGFLRTTPHTHHIDGFFGARLRRIS